MLVEKLHEKTGKALDAIDQWVEATKTGAKYDPSRAVELIGYALTTARTLGSSGTATNPYPIDVEAIKGIQQDLRGYNVGFQGHRADMELEGTLKGVPSRVMHKDTNGDALRFNRPTDVQGMLDKAYKVLAPYDRREQLAHARSN